MGGYAATAITAVTAQNTLGVHEVLLMPASMVRRQIRVVLDDIGADAIKIGMLGDAEIVVTVADAVADAGVPLVVDPVMIAKGGAALLANAALEAFRTLLLPRATLLTPNLPEAEVLLGERLTDPVEAALALRALGPGAVLLKGGHGESGEVTDVLVDADGLEVITLPRIVTRHTHGTGCTLASAIAAGLAQGMTLRAAVRRARYYVHNAIAVAPGFGSGHGPLNHGAGFTTPQ
jgi:hydroxymethylpyrimidine/phosphomethylpyrimidine kinase